MNRLKETIDRALAAVEITPALENRIVMGRGKRMKKKLRMALTAALVFLLVAGIAYATGIGRTIFSQMVDVLGGKDTQKYEEVDELSTRGADSRRLYIAPDMTLTLLQSYYDGAQLIIGYALEGNLPQVDFDYDSAPLTRIRSPYDATSEDITAEMTDEQRAIFQARYARDGSVGALIPHIDIVTVETSSREELLGGGTQVAGGMYEEFAVLPESAREKDSIEIALVVTITCDYVYMDETGTYSDSVDGLLQQEAIPFVIPRSTCSVWDYTGVYEDDQYTSSATVYVTPFNVRTLLHLNVPANWMYSGSDEDVPIEYALIVDGMPYEGELVLDATNMSDYTRDWEYEYVLEIADGAQLRLRPVYAISGAHPDEDIVLK